MNLRQMAVAFLINEEDKILLLQKKQNERMFSGLLVPIGGNIEKDELNIPEVACLREIEEETVLNSSEINKIQLRYIVHRLVHNKEIRIQYVFFGKLSKNITLIDSDEGSLEWFNYDGIEEQNVTATTIETLKHYYNIGKFNKEIYVGSMKSLKGKAEITWGLLEDWE